MCKRKIDPFRRAEASCELYIWAFFTALAQASEEERNDLCCFLHGSLVLTAVASRRVLFALSRLIAEFLFEKII